MVPVETTPNEQSRAVEYRAVQWSDLEDMVTIFDEAWGLGGAAQEPVNKAFCRRFVLHYLEGATHARAAVVNGGLVGVLLLRVPGKPVLFEQVHQELAHEDAVLAGLGEPGKVALASMECRHAAENDILRSSDMQGSDAEVALFMVSAKARGRGVGGSLWRWAMASLVEQGCKRFFLYTDSSCDVGFYDHHGLQCAVSRWAADHPEDVVVPGCDADDIFLYVGNAPELAERGR